MFLFDIGNPWKSNFSSNPMNFGNMNDDIATIYDGQKFQYWLSIEIHATLIKDMHAG